MSDLKLAPEYRDIADKLIEKFPIAFGHIEIDKVLFLKNEAKTPKKYAECRVVRPPYTFMTEYKFIITVFEPVVIGLSEAQLVMLIYHELLHIDVDFHKLKRHNIEDFRELITKYGINWDIDPNLVNILEDEDNQPTQNDNSTPTDLNEEEDEEPEF